MWKTEHKAQREKLLEIVSTGFQSALLRWALTITWTVVVASLMLAPAGDDAAVTEVSESFGGMEITDAGGHVVLNTVWALLWCWTISLYIPQARTLRLLLVVGLVWGLGTELAQHFIPERGVSLLDLSANSLGILIGLAIYRRLVDR